MGAGSARNIHLGVLGQSFLALVFGRRRLSCGTSILSLLGVVSTVASILSTSLNMVNVGVLKLIIVHVPGGLDSLLLYLHLLGDLDLVLDIEDTATLTLQVSPA